MRKCSAAGLDVLSTVFQEEMLPIVTPIVQQRLQVGPPMYAEQQYAVTVFYMRMAGCLVCKGCCEGEHLAGKAETSLVLRLLGS